MIIIGIDPDLHKSGWCVLNDGKIFELESLDFFEILTRLEYYKKLYPNATYAIEDVNKNKAVYNRKTSKQAMLKIAQNVGQVKAACTLLAKAIEKYTGIPPVLVPPGIGKQVKNNAKLFNELTGYTKQTNEDKRDAWAIAKYVNSISSKE